MEYFDVTEREGSTFFFRPLGAENERVPKSNLLFRDFMARLFYLFPLYTAALPLQTPQTQTKLVDAFPKLVKLTALTSYA
eukprot:6343366-Pyramimonas_sp.AAC.1